MGKLVGLCQRHELQHPHHVNVTKCLRFVQIPEHWRHQEHVQAYHWLFWCAEALDCLTLWLSFHPPAKLTTENLHFPASLQSTAATSQWKQKLLPPLNWASLSYLSFASPPPPTVPECSQRWKWSLHGRKRRRRRAAKSFHGTVVQANWDRTNEGPEDGPVDRKRNGTRRISLFLATSNVLLLSLHSHH